ncbi:unnamed protein product [Phytomonas sp. EM1]|nr:unnamed protein product [Phytomonas sp. EM1]|eukprot:CCW62944.1 unnamed protein product [Phytomonas sp. isolate EM1]
MSVLFLICTAALHVSSPDGGINDTVSPQFKGFHCQRSFSAMSSFRSFGGREAQKNCDFYYFEIENASAKVQCEVPNTQQSSEAGLEMPLNCSIELNIVAELAKDVSERFAHRVGSVAHYADMNSSPSAMRAVLLDSDDPWRYSFELRSTLGRGTAINYKGYNGQGYSLCCSAIPEAKCEWVHEEEGDLSFGANESLGEMKEERQATAQLVLSECPLPLPTPRGESHPNSSPVDSPPGREFFYIRVSRPLHRFVPGPWEARLMLWRQRMSFAAGAKGKDGTLSTADPEVLGRVIVPFELPEAGTSEIKDDKHQPLLPVVALTGAEPKEGNMIGDL